VHSVFGKINYGCLKHNRLYLGLVLPSGGWQSLVENKRTDVNLNAKTPAFDRTIVYNILKTSDAFKLDLF